MAVQADWSAVHVTQYALPAQICLDDKATQMWMAVQQLLTVRVSRCVGGLTQMHLELELAVHLCVALPALAVRSGLQQGNFQNCKSCKIACLNVCEGTRNRRSCVCSWMRRAMLMSCET